MTAKRKGTAAARRRNRGTFAPGPPPAIGETCARCHHTFTGPGVLVVDEDMDTPLGFLRRGVYIVPPRPCLLCYPLPLWPMAAANLAAAYNPTLEDAP